MLADNTFTLDKFDAMRSVVLFGVLSLFTLHSFAQSIHPEWDGFTRSQPSVQDNADYMAQNGRNDLSLFTRDEEIRLGVFSFDLSTISSDAGNVSLKLYNVTTSDLSESNVIVTAILHDLPNDVATTWHQLDLSSSFGDTVVIRTISDSHRNTWMDFTAPELAVKFNEARATSKKLALIVSYPSALALKFENSNNSNKPVLNYSGSPVAVSGVSLANSEMTISVGEISELSAIITPDNATNKGIYWSSSNEEVAMVSDGVIRGVSEGTSVITVITDDGGYTASLNLTVEKAAVTGITLSVNSEIIVVGSETTLLASVLPDYAVNKNVSWESSDNTVATVLNGVVSGINEGNALITVTTEEGGFSDNCEITVVSNTGLATDIDVQSPQDAQPLVNDSHENYSLIFSDEFNDAYVNPYKWNVQDAFYRDRGDIKLRADGRQIEEKEGHLFIYYHKDVDNDDTYYAGRIDSKNKYASTYGFLEARMHVVKPDGHQAAFWMMPQGNGMSVPEGVDGTANDGAEIDIVESNKTTSYSTGLHWDGYGADHKGKGGNISAPGMHDTEYHVFGFEWSDTFLRWYFDGELVREETDPKLIPHVPQYIYFSGSMWGNSNWVDGSILTNPLIQGGGIDEANIDYVRVYQPAVEPQPEKTTINSGKVWYDTNGKRINAHSGGIFFHNGVYYWYGTEKVEGLSEAQHADGGVHCYTSIDLINWHDQGMVLSLIKDDPTNDLAFEANMDRPKVIYNNTTEKFVLFFKLYPPNQGTGTAYVGVAVSDDPVGQFEYVHKFKGAGSENGSGDFAMFKDVDGKLYHLTVRKPDKSFVVGKMSDDYLLPDGDYQVLENITYATEAPAVFKRQGRYHMLSSGSSGWAPNTARYFSSSSLFGPWEFHGNPLQGVNPYNGLGPEKTFGGQSSYVIEVDGKEDGFIAYFDIHKPDHPYEGLYIWLPIDFEDDLISSIIWNDAWNLDYFGDVTLNVKEDVLVDSFRIYPNPANSYIKFSNEVAKVKVYTLTGTLVIEERANDSLNVSNLANGTYIISVILANGRMAKDKLIIRH